LYNFNITMNIPFTQSEFFEVFEKYNATAFPVQLIFLVLGIFALIQIHSGSLVKNRFIAALLGLLWIWNGLVYHILFFTSINKAAYLFGIFFLMQGIFFLIEASFRKKIFFEFIGRPQGYIGYIMALIGLFIYPLISLAITKSFNDTISLGLPCPTTIFTFGMLMLTTSLPRYLLIIPTLWAIIGFMAALNFGVYQDILLLLSALFADIFLLRNRRLKNRKTEF